ncbi:hypothetical protein LWC34_33115 [Kibdelosporangium philippinense]|uniref:Uncharacterized protein n=1 Tax=Kibdelosporangium philippinense TaxID=211113 RepID=A0ABS8ZIJ4_9PSEU|nr:hypothetical protein [Kibdelosporangium philippinense]MCE7007628.1 hypothetical protein [Kibdelosporangium philippinense]
MRRALLAAALLLLGSATPALAQDTVLLTVHHIGRDGTTAQQHDTYVVNKETYEVSPVVEGSIKLFPGQYALVSTINGAASRDLLTYPNLDMTKDVRLDLDARVAKPVVVKAPDPTAKLVFGDISVPFGGMDVDNLDGVAIAHLGPRTKDVTAWINTQWQGADFYALAWHFNDGLPDGFRRTPSHRELAKVHAKFGATRKGTMGYRTLIPATGPSDLDDDRGSAIAVEVPLPSERTEYYNTDTYWIPELRQVEAAEEPPPPWETDHSVIARPQRYPAGTYERPFNYAIVGPAVPNAGLPSPSVVRSPDQIAGYARMYSDGFGNAGWSKEDKGSTVLYRDGVKVGENNIGSGGFFDVPPQDSEYRLELTSNRASMATLSTQVSIAWTFRSSAAQTGLLPLSTMRFVPKLDGNDGKPAIVPVFLRAQHTEIDRLAKHLTMDVSFDQGATWKPAKVVGNAGAIIEYPPGASTVSLRAKATDWNSSTVEQTIINAYRAG